MKFIAFQVIVSCLILCAACSDIDSSRGRINIDVETFSPVTDFFDEVRYVILETNDSSIIGERVKFRLASDYNRIVAFSDQTGFTVFDGNGKWINTFDHLGEGPEEYIGITDFYLFKGELYAVSCYQSKILVYSIDTGECNRVINMADNYSDATWLNDNYIALCSAYNNTSLYNLAILNASEGKIEKNFLPYKFFDSSTDSNYKAFVGRDAEGVYVTLPYNTDLYYLTSDTCVVAETYSFNSPDKLPRIKMEDVNKREMEELTRTTRSVNWLGYFCKPSADMCYQTFELLTDYGNMTYISKYNPISCENRTFCVDATDEFPYLIWKPVLMNDDYYICAPKAEFILSYENISGRTTFTDAGLTHDSNPVIFFYHLNHSW